MSGAAPPSDRVVVVPRGLAIKDELLAFLARELEFQDWFGHNWDALYDCLCDLSGLGARRVILVHTDLPLSDPDERATYLDILRDATASLARTRDRELIATFPLDASPPA